MHFICTYIAITLLFLNAFVYIYSVYIEVTYGFVKYPYPLKWTIESGSADIKNYTSEAPLVVNIKIR